MKIIKNVLVDNEELELAQEQIILELNNTGRGFITVKTDKTCTGKSVIFELGEYDDYYQWFNGFVESEQQAENGYKKLFIRELIAKFERPLNCSLRHVTLQELAKWLTSETGIIFKIPEQNYSTTPIPHFTHTGNGFQLLNNIGRLFRIPHFMWQQSADGSVFVGSWFDSRWAEEDIVLDNDTTLSRSGRSMIIPITPSIRAGTKVNGKRIKKVELNGDNYILNWEELDENGKPLQKNAERQRIEEQFPELAGGYHLAKCGKVVAIADPNNDGDISDPFRPKYAVEIQLLTEDGEDDLTVPVYSAVPLPYTSPASQGGDFCYPEIGTIVELGFQYGRSDRPFIRSYMTEGKTMPSIKPGELLRQQRPEVFERIDQAGNIIKETDQQINEKSYTRIITTDSEEKDIGTAVKNINADNTETVGGNKTTQVVGSITEITASNKSVGVAGTFNERVQGISERLSEVKNRVVAPLSYMGSDGQNIFRLLEDLIQLVGDIAQTTATHDHGGSPPVQASTFKSQNVKALAIKSKLTPIIE
ncbi:hypothetical protein QJU93_10035 [Pasteurella skyensis]|uniref:Phage protein n=1 Tax=Phocoenobacter skyensis TaxID=97481 RepID=A0AAJ6NBC3_9PAST|nr:hypothetical protein [Pasteurella skyensis]MDP8173694.1 hypothetical protein [Pasteurella skyensis]MDP8178062.1 hypothetical protein [Pasteurella skyensis]